MLSKSYLVSIGLLFLTTRVFSSDQKVLYYGFVFDETTASSIKAMSDAYFKALVSQIPKFESFLKGVSASKNVSDTNEYFTKPLDPNSGEYDPLYHVTAKYCGSNHAKCEEYETENAKFIGQKFGIHLVGLVITSKTFGVRVDLTDEQTKLFDQAEMLGSSAQSAVTDGSSDLKPSDFAGEIQEATQPFPPVLPVTTTKAHVTLGCSPGVAAVVTGHDMVKVLRYERNETKSWRRTWDSIKDPLLSKNKTMMVTLYAPSETSSPEDYTFVIYPRLKVIAGATLSRYYQKPESSNSNLFFPSVVLLIVHLIGLCCA